MHHQTTLNKRGLDDTIFGFVHTEQMQQLKAHVTDAQNSAVHPRVPALSPPSLKGLRIRDANCVTTGDATLENRIQSQPVSKNSQKKLYQYASSMRSIARQIHPKKSEPEQKRSASVPR